MLVTEHASHYSFREVCRLLSYFLFWFNLQSCREEEKKSKTDPEEDYEEQEEDGDEDEHEEHENVNGVPELSEDVKQ